MKAKDLIKALEAEIQRTGSDFEIYTIDPDAGPCMLQFAKYQSNQYYIEPNFYDAEEGEILAKDKEDEDVYSSM